MSTTVPEEVEYSRHQRTTSASGGASASTAAPITPGSDIKPDPIGNNDVDLEAGNRPLEPPPPLARKYAGMADGPRHHITAVTAEFVGTFMFLLFAYVIANAANLAYLPSDTTKKDSNPAGVTMIAFGFGFSVMVCVFCFFRVSGGHLNPAVTLTLALVRAVPPIRAVILMVTQLIAGIAAAAVADALTPGEILFANALGEGVSRSRGVFLEMFATALLCMTVCFMAVEKHRATYMAPLVIGVALFVGHLFCVYYTGAGINPARSLGPNVVKGSFPDHHWIYWIGPILGSFLAAGLHYFIKFLHYETCNPGQDSDI